MDITMFLLLKYAESCICRPFISPGKFQSYNSLVISILSKQLYGCLYMMDIRDKNLYKRNKERKNMSHDFN